MERASTKRGRRAIATAMRAIDIWTAILLLTGQITASGIFISGGAIWFSMSGPIFGNERIEGKVAGANTIIDGIDVILALLLILGQITNTGPWISSGRFNMVVTGPALGYTRARVPIGTPPTTDKSKKFFADLRSLMIEREISTDDH